MNELAQQQESPRGRVYEDPESLRPYEPLHFAGMVMGAKRSATIAKVATALAAAQGEVSNAHKSSDNPYFNSRYADLAAVMDAMREPFAKHGLACPQFVRTTEPVKMGQSTDSDGVLQDDFLSYVDVETAIIHESGEFLAEVLRLPVWNPNPQKIGSAITYGRRYALQPVAGVAAEDDDGNAASGDRPKAAQQPPPKRREAPTAPPQEAPRQAARPAARPPARPAQDAPPPPAEPPPGFDEPHVEPTNEPLMAREQAEEIGALFQRLGFNAIQRSQFVQRQFGKISGHLTRSEADKLKLQLKGEIAARG